MRIQVQYAYKLEGEIIMTFFNVEGVVLEHYSAALAKLGMES